MTAASTFDAQVGPPLDLAVSGEAFVGTVVTTINGMLTAPLTPAEVVSVASTLRAIAGGMYRGMAHEHLSLGKVHRRFTPRDAAAETIERLLPRFRAARSRHLAHVRAQRSDRAGGVPVELMGLDRPIGGRTARTTPLFSTGGTGFSTSAVGGSGGSR